MNVRIILSSLAGQTGFARNFDSDGVAEIVLEDGSINYFDAHEFTAA